MLAVILDRDFDFLPTHVEEVLRVSIRPRHRNLRRRPRVRRGDQHHPQRRLPGRFGTGVHQIEQPGHPPQPSHVRMAGRHLEDILGLEMRGPGQRIQPGHRSALAVTAGQVERGSLGRRHRKPCQRGDLARQQGVVAGPHSPRGAVVGPVQYDHIAVHPLRAVQCRRGQSCDDTLTPRPQPRCCGALVQREDSPLGYVDAGQQPAMVGAQLMSRQLLARQCLTTEENLLHARSVSLLGPRTPIHPQPHVHPQPRSR